MLHYRHINMLTMSTSHVGVHGKAGHGHGRRSTIEKRTIDNFIYDTLCTDDSWPEKHSRWSCTFNYGGLYLAGVGGSRTFWTLILNTLEHLQVSMFSKLSVMWDHSSILHLWSNYIKVYTIDPLDKLLVMVVNKINCRLFFNSRSASMSGVQCPCPAFHAPNTGWWNGEPVS